MKRKIAALALGAKCGGRASSGLPASFSEQTVTGQKCLQGQGPESGSSALQDVSAGKHGEFSTCRHVRQSVGIVAGAPHSGERGYGRSFNVKEFTAVKEDVGEVGQRGGSIALGLSHLDEVDCIAKAV